MRKGGYVRTELGYAEALWPDPAEHVLAIRCDEVSDEQVPAYLSSNLNLITLDGNFATEARNMVLARLAQPARMPDLALGNLDELPVAECVSRLVSALSRRRKLPPTGTATVEAQHEVDALAIIIKRRFKPDEGSTVAGARLVKVIGVGNFGTVWEAIDQESGQPVAVKIFRLERLNEGQMLFRFRKSIRAMRLLSEEKRLAKQKQAAGTVVKFLCRDNTDLAFSMELLTRGNLDDVSKHGWSLPHKLELTARICTAVSYSHASGVIHRDIKPANIVLNDGGLAVLTDFDIADVKFATSMSTTVEGGLGTPVFAAPEQLRDAELANERSDVYSLGRLLHYLLLERSPGYQVEKDPVLRDLGEFPPALVEVVRCATQFDPARRYESVDKMQTALLACHTGAAALRARVTRTARWARHNWALLVITFLTIGALSGFAAYQARVAKREATLASRFEELSTKLAALSSEKQQATDKKQTAEERIRELSDRIKAAPSDQLSPLQAELARVQKDRDEALTQLDTIDAKEKEIQAQIEAAKNTEVKRDRSEITQNKVARRGVRPARSLGGWHDLKLLRRYATDRKQGAEERIRGLKSMLVEAYEDQLAPLNDDLAKAEKDRDDPQAQLDLIDAAEAERLKR